jgi:hypothetical protein
MFARVAIAIVGAVVVTGSLLLVMDSLTSLWQNERGERYFRITDVLQKPDPGRPERPQAATPPPDRPADDSSNPDGPVRIETPADIDIESPPGAAPAIERPDLPAD